MQQGSGRGEGPGGGGGQQGGQAGGEDEDILAVEPSQNLPLARMFREAYFNWYEQEHDGVSPTDKQHRAVHGQEYVGKTAEEIYATINKWKD